MKHTMPLLGLSFSAVQNDVGEDAQQRRSQAHCRQCIPRRMCVRRRFERLR
jgi:hypothetical protein